MIFLIWWILLLTILVGALAISFYRLYVQAEKAQKTAFTGEVLKVGREIAEKFNDRINEEFMSDTALVSFSESADSPDTHTLLVMNDGVPSALLTQTVTEYQGNLGILCLTGSSNCRRYSLWRRWMAWEQRHRTGTWMPTPLESSF